MTHSFNRLLYPAILTVLMLAGGCVTEDPGGKITVMLRDAQRGHPVDQCLLVTVFSTTDTSLETVIGERNSTYKDTNGRIRKVTSTFVLEQPPVSRPVIPLGLMWITKYGYYVHFVYCSGYRPTFFADVGEKAQADLPLTIDLKAERPGDPASDREILDRAHEAVADVIPAVASDDPLRPQLIHIVESQVRRVRGASKDESTISEADALISQMAKRFGCSTTREADGGGAP